MIHPSKPQPIRARRRESVIALILSSLPETQPEGSLQTNEKNAQQSWSHCKKRANRKPVRLEDILRQEEHDDTYNHSLNVVGHYV